MLLALGEASPKLLDRRRLVAARLKGGHYIEFGHFCSRRFEAEAEAEGESGLVCREHDVAVLLAVIEPDRPSIVVQVRA